MASGFLISDDLRFAASARELSRMERDGATTRLPLGSRAADLLLVFLQRPGELVTKGEIMDAVWPGTTVEDSNLPVQIAALRRVLDAGRDGGSAISTVPGRGYRFTLPVRREEDGDIAASPAASPAAASPAAASPAAASPAAASPAPADYRPGRAAKRWLLATGIAAALLVVAFVAAKWTGSWTGFPAGHSVSRDAAGPPTVSNRAAAMAGLDEEIRRNPNSALGYYKRGEAYRATGDADRAIADLSEAIRLDPKFARGYLNRGRAYWLKHDADRAIADLGDAIQLDATLTEAFNFRCFVYNSSGDFDHAVADCSAAIGLDPTFATAYYNRGLAYLAKDDIGRAIADFTTATGIDPKSAVAFFNRGRAYFHGGDFAKAQADFRRALALTPNFFRATLWLDIAERRGKLPRELEQSASRLNITAWPAPVVRMLLGDLTLAQVLAAADDKDPTTRQGRVCQANFYGGELALSQDAREEAARLLRLAADACPPSEIERQSAAAELKALASRP
jgi:DNA-binding winged helix-turn-helix (wHTH) protein/lipoprotein NlpI